MKIMGNTPMFNNLNFIFHYECKNDSAYPGWGNEVSENH